MKKILVPTDFSPNSIEAIEVAAQIAKKTDARLYLLHVVNIPSYVGDNLSNTFQDTTEGLFLLKLAQKRFKELLSKSFLKNVNVVEALQFNDSVFDQVDKQVTKNNIDLIVMGSKGTSGLKEMMIGSNTEKVIRMSPCPVLTIKQRDQKFSPKNIVFASNFLKEAEAIFPSVCDFADLFGSRIHLLKIITPASFEKTGISMKTMNDFAKKFKLKNYTANTYNDVTVEDAVISFCKETNADMVSMGTHGRTGVSHLFSGSIAEDVANHASRPLLTFRIKK